MERDKLFFRHILLHYFDIKKTAAETQRKLVETYGDSAPSKTTCKDWFRKFKSGDFDVRGKERSVQPKKFDDTELQTLLDQNQSQTLQELSETLNVTSTVSKRSHAMGGKTQKGGKTMPHKKLAANTLKRVSIAASSLAKKNETKQNKIKNNKNKITKHKKKR